MNDNNLRASDICECGHPWGDHNQGSANHECLKSEYEDDGKLIAYDMCTRFVQSNIAYLLRKHEQKETNQ